MDKGSFGMLLLTVVAIGASVLFHLRGRGFFLASVTSAITAASVLLIVDAISQGAPDKRFQLAFVIGAGYAFLISLVVGWITRWWVARRKRNDQEK